MPVHYSLKALQYVLVIWAFFWLLWAYIGVSNNAPSWYVADCLVGAALLAGGSFLVAIVRRYLRKKPRSESDLIMP